MTTLSAVLLTIFAMVMLDVTIGLTAAFLIYRKRPEVLQLAKDIMNRNREAVTERLGFYTKQNSCCDCDCEDC